MEIEFLLNYGIPADLVGQFKTRGFKTLTAVQAAALDAGLVRSQSLVIAAPTSSGKTTIAELAAVVAAQQGRRTVYLVTHKALAEEKYRYFKQAYDAGRAPWFSVAISTGDRIEGTWDSGILIATYEKFLSLISTKVIGNIGRLVVVADEVQTVAATSRGADIEILCTILLHTKPAQFIGLTATAPNVPELADWLCCVACEIKTRDVPLRQEVWYGGNATYSMSGDASCFSEPDSVPEGIASVAGAKALVGKKLSPVLVFCMTKPRAEQLAIEYAGLEAKTLLANDVTRQLDFFSEPTSLGDRLKEVTQRRVAFHTADLSFSERAVVEQALRDGQLDVVFATPTLAAGVNLPIRTVVFDSFHRSWLPEPLLPQSEFTNMAGRAGRLGFHDQGNAVLLPTTRIQYETAHRYITEQPERVRSVLMESGIRKPVLQLLSCGVCDSHQTLIDFFEKTLWFKQTIEANSVLANQLCNRIQEAVDWLGTNGLVLESGGKVVATELGRAVSATGLLPSTAITILSVVQTLVPEALDENILALFHLACASDEFSEEIGHRFLPFARNNSAFPVAYHAIRSVKLFIDPNAQKDQPKIDNAAYILSLWVAGQAEPDLGRAVPSIRYGQLQALANDVGWIFEGMASILKSPAVNTDPKLATEFELLAKRIKLGVTIDAIDVLDAAKTDDVPGFGRHRAMKLVAADAAHPNKLLSLQADLLANLVDGIDRAKALLNAVAGMFSRPMEFWRNRHVASAKDLRADVALVEALYDTDGLAYEDLVVTLLRRMDLPAEKFDDGKKQGVPDIVIRFKRGNVFLECKSREHKKSSPISTEDAFAILTKANDLQASHFVTVAKPDVGSHAKKKATSAGAITLVSHKSLIQAYLAYFSGKVPAHKIESWLCQPGVAHDIDL
jgi:helicase